MLSGLAAYAQDSSTDVPTEAPAANTRGSIFSNAASDLLRGDFVNYYGFASAVFDSTQQVLGGGNGGAGFSIGGGVEISKHFSDATLGLNYRGDYRDYSGGFGGSGTDQNFSFIFAKQLSRRWTLSLNTSGGILFYDSPYFRSLNTGGVDNNPLSPSTRFLASGVALSYRQTQRLSYTISGNFFLARYSYPGAIGSTGGIGSGSVAYQVTARTSIGGTYSHDNFYFQKNAGTTDLDGGYFNVNHLFGRTWNVRGSGGVTRAHTYGNITQPVQAIINGSLVTIYLIRPYDTRSIIPTFEGSVSHIVGRLSFTAHAGHGVNPGNGTYLTSSHTFLGGSVSQGLQGSVVSGSYFYSRVSSIANQVSQAYTQNTLTLAYSRILRPHLSAYANYNYIRYGTLINLGSSTDNRFIIGLSLSSKNVPISGF